MRETEATAFLVEHSNSMTQYYLAEKHHREDLERQRRTGVQPDIPSEKDSPFLLRPYEKRTVGVIVGFIVLKGLLWILV